MKHRCKIQMVGTHTAWIAVEGREQILAVPKELVSNNSDPDGPLPGDTVRKMLPSWVLEAVNLR